MNQYQAQVQVACLACAKLQGAHHNEAPGEGEPDIHHDEAPDDEAPGEDEPPWLLGRVCLIPIMMTLLMMKLLPGRASPLAPGEGSPAKTYLAQLLLPAQPTSNAF